MLHRAATTAYSWWWASHIRTKQSKWLEQNLEDMEEKVKFMLRIIEQEGDSFAKRAEMYYKKRPELIGIVEETYKSYRALAERFDHISKDLQSANRTIATVFPEQVHLALESEEDDRLTSTSARGVSPVVPTKNLPKAPKLPSHTLVKGGSMLASKREKLRRNSVTAITITASGSGLTKDEANTEIGTLQKHILTWQTEKEFMKSAYETALAKFLELESKITDSQTRVCVLQDEFGVGTVMEDYEARTLMAGSALKSCSEALEKLQDEQKSSMDEVKKEYERIQEAHQRLASLKKLGDEKSKSEAIIQIEPDEGEDEEGLRERIREALKSGSEGAFTEPEMADKIDDLVEKIVNLETVVCSYKALVKRLKQEIDELLTHIKALEEQKQPILEGTPMSLRLKELEDELIRVNMLNKQVLEQKKCINEEITETGCNLDHLKEKMDDLQPSEETEFFGLFKEKDTKVGDKKEEVESAILRENQEQQQQQQEIMKEENVCSRTAEVTISDTELKLSEGDGLDWRQLYMNNMEDREKILVEEYTMVFRDYKDIKMKLSEVEKKHRDQIFEMASHVRELRNTVTGKEEEIQLLLKKLSDVQAKRGEENEDLDEDQNDTEDDENKSCSDRQPLFHHLYDRDAFIKEVMDGNDKKEGRVKIEMITEFRGVVGSKGRFRLELDKLLEGNLEFWLRFSTSFHHIQKLETGIKDLQEEVMKLKRKEDSTQQSVKSDARPLYKHLREIQTELTVWSEHSVVFQDELNSRLSSLNNIQDEITKVSSDKEEDKELSHYQAAKFHGEILNMKHENSKVAEELQAGVHRAKVLKQEVSKLVAKLDKEFGFSEPNPHNTSSGLRNSFHFTRIPLHSFLFGVKLRRHSRHNSTSSRPSILACVTPTLPKEPHAQLE